MSAGAATPPLAATTTVAPHSPVAINPSDLIDVPSRGALEGRHTLASWSQTRSSLTVGRAHDIAADAVSTRHPKVALTGEAVGDYTTTTRPPDTGAQYHLTATGMISPLGAAAVSGSFQMPGFIHGGRASGGLTIAGSAGTLTLRLTAARARVEDVSNDVGRALHSGAMTSRAATSTSGGPIILLNDFAYTILKGTGRHAHARGSGTVEITTTPGLTVPIEPAIYNVTASPITGSGRTTLTFRGRSGPFRE
jgi:hypothetical protein